MEFGVFDVGLGLACTVRNWSGPSNFDHARASLVPLFITLFFSVFVDGTSSLHTWATFLPVSTNGPCGGSQIHPQRLERPPTSSSAASLESGFRGQGFGANKAWSIASLIMETLFDYFSMNKMSGVSYFASLNVEFNCPGSELNALAALFLENNLEGARARANLLELIPPRT